MELVDGRFAVGRNSLLVLGDKDSAWAQKAVQDALDNADLTWGKRFRHGCILAIKSSQKLSATGALLVDGSLADRPHPFTREYGNVCGAIPARRECRRCRW